MGLGWAVTEKNSDLIFYEKRRGKVNEFYALLSFFPVRLKLHSLAL